MSLSNGLLLAVDMPHSEQESIYQSILEVTKELIKVLDSEGNILYASPSHKQIIGLDSYSYTGLNYIGLQSRGQKDFSLLKRFRKSVCAGSPFYIEELQQHTDGRWIRIRSEGTPVYGYNGQFKHMVLKSSDIIYTQEPFKLHDKGHSQLTSNSYMLDFLMKDARNALCIIDEHGNIFHVNEVYERMFGWRLDELRGKRHDNIPAKLHREKEMLSKQVDSGHSIAGFDTFRQKKDGTVFPVHITACPIYERCERVGYAAVITDKSEDKKVEDLMRRADKLSVVGQLAAGVAHEIRNPVTALKGFVKLLQVHNERHPEYCKIMDSELDRISTITDEMLLLANPRRMEFQLHNVTETLSSIICLLETHARMNNTELVACFPHHPVPVFCAENKLKQVFINVLKNALEAMPGGGQIFIHLTRTDPHSISLCFTDQGVGIPKSKLAKLGEPFYTTKENGTGLGFMISKKIIEDHNGSIQVRSEINQGTTVEIRLPADASLEVQFAQNTQVLNPLAALSS